MSVVPGVRAANWVLNKLEEKAQKKSGNCCKAFSVAVVTGIGGAITWAFTKADGIFESRIANLAEATGIAPGARAFSMGAAGSSISSHYHTVYKQQCSSIFDDFPACTLHMVGVAAGAGIALLAFYQAYKYINYVNKRYE